MSEQYIICTVSDEKLYCTPERMEKLISKYGSKRKLKQQYVSRNSKLMKSMGYTDTDIQNYTKKERQQICKDERERVKREKNKKREEKLEKRKRIHDKEELSKKFKQWKQSYAGPRPKPLPEIQKITERTCLNPHRFVTINMGCCNGCKWYEVSGKRFCKFPEANIQ